MTYCYDGLTLSPVQQTCTSTQSASGFVLGRLTGIGTSASTTNYTNIGNRGWILSSQQTTDSQPPYAFPSYNYYLNGALASVTYPSGRTVSYGLDSAGRVNAVNGTYSGQNTSYASGIQYAPFDAIQQASFGSNGLSESWTYNNRMQPIGMTRSIGSTPLLTVGTAYCAGTATDCASNNGNLLSESATRNGASAPWVQSFTYDSVNRLYQAIETVSGTQSWQETYGYDAYGNRSIAASTFTWSTMTPPGFDSATNRNSGGGWNPSTSYDSVGNVIVDAMGGTYAYDAENRMVSTGTSSYSYDGEGRRVTRNAGGTVTTYVYDAAGELAAEYGVPSAAGTQYLGVDNLGSTRLATDSFGNLPSNGGCHDYMPFGAELQGTGNRGSCFGGADAVIEKFTGKERDAETGLDYFQRRYLSSAQGRFTSPDPVGIITQKLLDPQQWNMYSYVRNNPLRLLDPTGEYVANCGDGVKNCEKQIQQFEKTRVQALKSKDEGIRNAAGAYGGLGENNGVNLTIANVVDKDHSDVQGTVSAQKGTGGLTFNSDTNTFQQATQVTIQSGLSGNALEGVLVHEGTHVEDRANFVNSISLGGPPDFNLTFNPALNITGRQSELNAYGVENNFLRSIGQPQRNIGDILSHPPYSDNPNIDKPLFIDIGKPQK